MNWLQNAIHSKTSKNRAAGAFIRCTMIKMCLDTSFLTNNPPANVFLPFLLHLLSLEQRENHNHHHNEQDNNRVQLALIIRLHQLLHLLSRLAQSRLRVRHIRIQRIQQTTHHPLIIIALLRVLLSDFVSDSLGHVIQTVHAVRQDLQ